MIVKYKYKKGFKVGATLLDEHYQSILDSDLVKKEAKRLFRLTKPKKMETAGDRLERADYIRISEIVANDELRGTIAIAVLTHLDEAYQRRAFWDVMEQSAFIDTIMCNGKLPVLHFIDHQKQLDKHYDPEDNFCLEPRTVKKYEDLLALGKFLSTFDGNNRIFAVSLFFHGYIKWVPSKRFYETGGSIAKSMMDCISFSFVGDRGYYYDDLPPELRDRFLDRPILTTFVYGVTQAEISDDFDRVHSTGYMNAAERRNSMDTMICLGNRIPGNKVVDQNEAYNIDPDNAPFPELRILNSKYLERRQIDEQFAMQNYVHVHYDPKKDFPNTGEEKDSIRSDNRLRSFYRQDKLYAKKLMFTSPVWEGFVKINNVWLDEDGKKRSDLLSSQVCDITLILEALKHLPTPMKIRDASLFQEKLWKPLNTDLANKYYVTKADRDAWAATRKKKGLKNPKSDGWEEGKGNAWAIKTINNRKDWIYDHLSDPSNLEKYWDTGVIDRIRTTLDTDIEEQLIELGQMAPNVTAKDILEKKTEIDHFVPFSWPHRGPHDVSNLWIVLKDDHGQRQSTGKGDLCWFELFEERHGINLAEWFIDQGFFKEALTADRLKAVSPAHLAKWAGQTKLCAKCKVNMPITEFQKDRTHKDGLKSSCKECRNKMEKESKRRRNEAEA